MAAAALDVACYGLQSPSIQNAEVIWITSSTVRNFTYPPVVDLTREPVAGTTGNSPQLTFCIVSMALTHPGDNDTVFVSVWLPSHDTWNNRYTATGGGGLAAGYDFNMEDGTVNEALFKNLGYRSIHDMAVASKDVIKQFYGVDASYSYWTGCSQGGRQGYAAAAKNPTDFDGILAAAPGLGFSHVGLAAFWPVVVMHNEGEYVPSCIFDKYQEALLESCDPDDGFVDGLISDYDLLMSCPRSFNASTLIGRTVICPEAANVTLTITKRHATIVTKILNGPTHRGKQYWLGTVPGATFSGVAETAFDPATGEWVPKPFLPAVGWLANIIAPQMGIEIESDAGIFTLTYDQYFAIFTKSLALAFPYLGDSYLDLRSFQNTGGKLLTWVGPADQIVHPAHLFDFHASVSQNLSPGNPPSLTTSTVSSRPPASATVLAAPGRTS